MAARASRPELLAIVGPTASGKSALAMKIARKYRGEIIAADSRTIYKGMDIGTAKPTKHQQKQIPHWGLDLTEPGKNYSAAQFKDYAQAQIKQIQKRGNLPVLAGGTGLYIDSLLFGFEFPPKTDKKQRQELELLEIEQLKDLIIEQGYKFPYISRNKRHLVRTIERQGQIGSKRPHLRPGTLVIGLMPKDDDLRDRINTRAEGMFNHGIVDETEKLVKKYGQKAVFNTGGIVYRICTRLIKEEITEAEAVDLFKTADWQYARRQKTWFKRNKFIQWFSSPEGAYQEISTILNN